MARSQMRDAFRGWVEDDMPDQASVEVYYERVKWPAEKLLGRMPNCTDAMPGELCDRLGMERGFTYAAAGERLLRERSASKS